MNRRNSFSPQSRRTFRLLIATLLMAAGSTALAQSSTRHLLYVPSTEAGVDHAAVVDALSAQGFAVDTYAAESGEDRLAHARRVAREVRTLIAHGTAPDDISVVGAGTGTPVAALASAVVGNAHVNYVLLGRCDPVLKYEYRFRASGRVLGIRDDADGASHSCRSLWNESPRVTDRQDLVLDTGHGAALFHAPREEWMRLLVQWSGGGRVTVGDVRVTQVRLPAVAF
jgi:hypothetical protein